jgi:phenylacetate-CoA ligase
MPVASTIFPDRAALAAHQLAQLQALLKTLLPANAFYTGKLQTAGVSADIESLGAFTKCVPFTHKRELIEDQRNNPPYGTNLTYPLDRYTRLWQTSATSGNPLRWLDTPESHSWMLDNWAVVYDAAGVTAQDRVFFAFSFGLFLGFWTAFESAARIGCLCLPGGGMRSAARLQTIIDNQATVLCCTPTYAIRLAEVAAEENIDLSQAQVKTIIVAGEPGAGIPATRAHIESLWNGARLFDHHGMTETGPASYECPQRPGVLHVIESAFIPEVIDPETGMGVAPGEMGELVLTNLGRVASPLLRYRTGDLVRPDADARCACGSLNMALEGGILGRSDDMVIVRGVNLYPTAVEEVVRSCGGIAEYRVEIRTGRALQELEVQIEPLPNHHGDPGALAQQLQLALHKAFSLRIPVSFVQAGSLPRFELKAKRWFKV